jgi:predicted site-specific integrase-resolvase
MASEHVTQADLAARWQVSPRTLERWRWVGTGPAFVRIGGSVRYRVEDIEAYERRQRRDKAASRPTTPLRVVPGRRA